MAEIEREGFVACVIDSRGAAQDGPLSYETETNRFFDAIALLGVPALVIDHLPKSELEDGATGVHSFGSVFTRGRVVCSWRVNRAERTGTSVTIEWSCAKWNHGARMASRAYKVDWSDGLKVNLELPGTSMHRSMVYDYLSEDGPAAIPIIASSIQGITEAEIKTVFDENPDMFVQTTSGGWKVVPPRDWDDPGEPF
jgi:hypothetical protein